MPRAPCWRQMMTSLSVTPLSTDRSPKTVQTTNKNQRPAAIVTDPILSGGTIALPRTVPAAYAKRLDTGRWFVKIKSGEKQKPSSPGRCVQQKHNSSNLPLLWKFILVIK